jgi:hypothetical protein
LVFDVVILFFLLGVFARLVKSDLRLPEALYETLSIYLLLAIGLKGGLELSKQPLIDLLPQVLAVVLLSFLIPFLLYPLLRALRFSIADSASIGAHFGSVSVVTFAVVTATLMRAAIPFEGHAALWVAVMEAPGIVAGVLIAKLFADGAKSSGQNATQLKTLLHDVIFGKSVLLLLGGLLIGYVGGVEGTQPIQALFVEPFKGVLALFLLELGLVAGAHLSLLRQYGVRVILVGVMAPPILAMFGLLLGALLGLSAGGIAILATLAASASYIAAPTAMRIAVPEGNAGLSITIALGVAFPFNIVLGIPLYIAAAGYVANWMA